MKIIITEQQLNLLVESQSKGKSKFFELLIKYMYEPKSRYPFSLWGIHKNVKNWADITYVDGYDKDGKEIKITESLDLENNEILHLDKNKLVILANGDWQPEHVATIKLVNGKLTMTECRPYDKNKDKGPRPKKNELLEMLGLLDDYKEVQKQEKIDKERKLTDRLANEYNEWNNGGYEEPTEASVLEFLQNTNEYYSENKKLIKDILNKLKSNINESKDNVSIETSIRYLHNIPKEYKDFAIEHLKSYTKANNGRITGLSLPDDFQKKLKADNLPDGFDMGVDKDGYYIHTHRGRSKSKEDYMKIPKKDIEFINSTG